MNQPLIKRSALIEKARRKGLTVHGSVYPGANPKQDSRYAQVVADNIVKRKAKRKEEEAA